MVSPIRPRMMTDVRIDKRNGDRNDERRAPAAEKHKDHHRGQCGGNDGFADHTLHSGANEDTLIGQRSHLQFRRHCAGDPWQKCAHALHHIERGGVTTLQDRNEYAAPAVLPHDVGLKLEAIAHAGDVAQVDGGAVHLFDRNVREFLESYAERRSSARRIPIGPTLMVPEGITTLCCANAFNTSPGAMPFDCIAA